MEVGNIVVFTHPFKPKVTCVKRVKRITDSGLFVEGDNPDPLASEDSHNFGIVSLDAIIAIHSELASTLFETIEIDQVSCSK